MELADWFKGFENGLARLAPGQRAAFFSECARQCVDGGVFDVYKGLHDEAHGDMDAFFTKANDLPGVAAEVVESGRVYHLVFLECTCMLCKKGYVTTPLLCECSRQSVACSLRRLWPEREFRITLCRSILRGGQDCLVEIEVL